MLKANGQHVLRKFSLRRNGRTRGVNTCPALYRESGDYDVYMCSKYFNPYLYSTLGLDGRKGYNRRAFCRKILKQSERTAVKKYISLQDWDKPIDYRGMKTTVSYDCH